MVKTTGHKDNMSDVEEDANFKSELIEETTHGDGSITIVVREPDKEYFERHKK